MDLKTHPSTERHELETLVCFALNEEATQFRKVARETSDIIVMVTGIGRENAAKAVRKFLMHHLPRQVFTCGFAGGLNPDLKTGAVIFSTGDPKLEKSLAGAGATRASFVCTERIATTVEEKQKLRALHGADAVEMESDAILQICREQEIPCAVVRAISDTASENLPLDFNALSKADKSIHFGKLALAVAKSPHKIAALLALQRKTSLAARNLAHVLEQVTFP